MPLQPLQMFRRKIESSREHADKEARRFLQRGQQEMADVWFGRYDALNDIHDLLYLLDAADQRRFWKLNRRTIV